MLYIFRPPAALRNHAPKPCSETYGIFFDRVIITHRPGQCVAPNFIDVTRFAPES